jgi:adenylate cyclase
MLKGWGAPEGELSAARAMELARRRGVSWEKSWRALGGVWLTASFLAGVSRASEVATQMLAIAEQHQNTELTAASLVRLGYSQIHAGNLDRAAECIDRAISLIQTIPKAPGRDIMAYGIWAWNTWFLGFPNRAANQMNQLFALARGLNSKVLEQLLRTFAVYFFFLLQERERMRDHATALLTLATELRGLSSRAQAEIYLGWLDSVEHDRPEVIERMQRALAEYRATGTLSLLSFFLSLIAQAQGRFGRYGEALVAIDEALTLIEETGERIFEADVHRIKGELLLAQNLSTAAEAEESFRTAIDIAARQDAKSWELRAATSLARLLRDTNRRDEARTMLAEIYGWFTEGFDTADLKDAKALLDELSA